jgi:hypothetical protein
MAKKIIKARTCDSVPAKRTQTEPVDFVDPALIPDDLLEEFAADAGAGVSEDPDDNLIPMVSILDTKSRYVDKHNAEYIQGAEPGMIFLKGSLNPLIPGEVGFECIPCEKQRRTVEWVSRDKGGGFVTSHEDMPADAEAYTKADNPDRVFYRRANGNELVDTRYHYVLINGCPYVIPMTSTNHTVSRGWNTMMRQLILPNGQVAPCYAKKYKLTARYKTDRTFSWFIWNVSPAGWTTKEEREKAREFREAIHNRQVLPGVDDDVVSTNPGPVKVDDEIPF